MSDLPQRKREEKRRAETVSPPFPCKDVSKKICTVHFRELKISCGNTYSDNNESDFALLHLFRIAIVPINR